MLLVIQEAQNMDGEDTNLHLSHQVLFIILDLVHLLLVPLGGVVICIIIIHLIDQVIRV